MVFSTTTKLSTNYVQYVPNCLLQSQQPPLSEQSNSLFFYQESMTRKIKSNVKCVNNVEINPAAQCANAHSTYTAPDP
jgi:hypothetical protein